MPRVDPRGDRGCHAPAVPARCANEQSQVSLWSGVPDRAVTSREKRCDSDLPTGIKHPGRWCPVRHRAVRGSCSGLSCEIRMKRTDAPPVPKFSLATICASARIQSRSHLRVCRAGSQSIGETAILSTKASAKIKTHQCQSQARTTITQKAKALRFRSIRIRFLGLNRSAVGSDGGGLKKEAAQSARQRH